jgi:hypothetical protein
MRAGHQSCDKISKVRQGMGLGWMELIKKLLNGAAVFSVCTTLSLVMKENTSLAVGGHPWTREAKPASSDSRELIHSDIQPLSRDVGDNVSKLSAAPTSGKGQQWERAPSANLMPPGEAVDSRAAVSARPAPFLAPTDDGPSPTPLDRHNEAALPATSPPTPTEVMPAQERRQPVLPVVRPNVPRPPARPLLEAPGEQPRPAGPSVARTPQQAVLPPRREADRRSTSEVPRRDSNLGSPSGAGAAGPSLPLPLRPTR